MSHLQGMTFLRSNADRRIDGRRHRRCPNCPTDLYPDVVQKQIREAMNLPGHVGHLGQRSPTVEMGFS
jgi:hypothetical protein